MRAATIDSEILRRIYGYAEKVTGNRFITLCPMFAA